MTIKNFILSCLLFASLNIHAQNNIWTDSEQIKAVQVMNNGGFMIILDSEKEAICPNSDNNVLVFSPNQNDVSISGAKSLLSTALIAFTTEKKVKILHSFPIGSNYCWGQALYLSN